MKATVTSDLGVSGYGARARGTHTCGNGSKVHVIIITGGFFKKRKKRAAKGIRVQSGSSQRQSGGVAQSALRAQDSGCRERSRESRAQKVQVPAGSSAACRAATIRMLPQKPWLASLLLSEDCFRYL